MTNSTKYTRGKKGRPKISVNEKKRALNLTVSDKARNGLEKCYSDFELKGISELNEKIGLGELKVIIPATISAEPSLENIEVYRRLKSLIQEPVAVFASILAFIWRSAWQFNLKNKLEININGDLISDILKEAIGIVFALGYIYPDIYINNPSALIRSLCFEILDSKLQCENSLEIEPKSSHKFDNTSTLVKVCETYSKLISARSTLFNVLKMKVIDKMTLSQIQRILKLQDENKTEDEIIAMIKRGLCQLREFTEDIDGVFEHNAPHKARRYYEISSNFYIEKNSQEIKEMRNLIIDSLSDSSFDFWMNEIDYHLGEEFFKKYLPGENFRKKISDNLKKINDEIDDLFLLKKDKIDQQLAFCTTREKLFEIFQENTISYEWENWLQGECHFNKNNIMEDKHVKQAENHDYILQKILEMLSIANPEKLKQIENIIRNV